MDSKKSNIRYLHIKGCPSKAKLYRLNEKKLESRNVEGYSKRSSVWQIKTMLKTIQILLIRVCLASEL